MTDGDGQPQPIGQFFLEWLFPDPTASAVGAATIGFNQPLGCPWKAQRQLSLTPAQPMVHCQSRGIGGLPDGDRPAIMSLVVNALGHGSSLPFTEKVRSLHGFRRLTPNRSSMLEIPHPFLFLGIDTQAWVSWLLMLGALLTDGLELPSPLRMAPLCSLLDLLPQPVAVRLEQPTDDRQTHPRSNRRQRVLQVTQSPVQPLPRADWVSGSVGLNQPQPLGHSLRVFFSAFARPPPVRRIRPAGVCGNPAANSVRPRSMVFSFKPVIGANTPSLGAPAAVDRVPTDHRRWASSKRLNSRLIWRW